MEFVSIRPLLDALDRAAESTIAHFASEIEIDRILISADLREKVVASVFAASDDALVRFGEARRSAVADYLHDRVAKEYARLPANNKVDDLGAGCHINWHSLSYLQREYGGSYDRYMRG